MRERELILATLRITGGSRKLTAERLGISPRTLRHKLQQLKAAGVSVPRAHEQQFVTATDHEQHADQSGFGGNACAAGARRRASPNRRPQPRSPRTSRV